MAIGALGSGPCCLVCKIDTNNAFATRTRRHAQRIQIARLELRVIGLSIMVSRKSADFALHFLLLMSSGIQIQKLSAETAAISSRLLRDFRSR